MKDDHLVMLQYENEIVVGVAGYACCESELGVQDALALRFRAVLDELEVMRLGKWRANGEMMSS